MAKKTTKKKAAKKAAKKTPAKKVTKKAAKKALAKKVAKKAAKKAPSKKPSTKKTTTKKKAPIKDTMEAAAADNEEILKPKKKVVLNAFVKAQRQRLLDLRDELVEAMEGVARDSLRVSAEGGDASAFGMHTADAGSDAYDRDFALNLLSKEQDGLYEIEEALERVSNGTYGICEITGKPIPQARLEAIPFARLTVECQTELEKHQRAGGDRHSLRELFGTNDGAGDAD